MLVDLYGLINILKKNKKIISILLVGSYSEHKHGNDIDLLLVTKSKKSTSKYLKKVFDNYETYINDDSYRVNGYFQAEIGIALYEANDLNSKINDYLNGNNIDPIYKNWNIVGWLPECLLCDLKRSKILYEKNNYITNIKEEIREYPKQLKKAIIDNCNKKIRNISNRLERANNLERKIIEAEIISLKIRKVFADREMYFSGYKNIDKTLYNISVHEEDL